MDDEDRRLESRRSRDDISTRVPGRKADDTRGGGKDKRERRNLERAVSIATRDDDAPRVSRSTVRPNSRPACVCVCVYDPTYNAANNAGKARATSAFSIDARSTCHVRLGERLIDRFPAIRRDLDVDLIRYGMPQRERASGKERREELYTFDFMEIHTYV